MSQRKYLTFKPIDPEKVKLIGIIFVVAFFFSPSVRYHTGEAFHVTGNLIQNTAK